MFYSLEVSFGTSQIGLIGAMTGYVGDCVLSLGEIVTRVEIYQYQPPFTAGLKFITSLKTCGPYGLFDETKAVIVAGNQLLFVYGRKGGIFDKLSFAFDRC